MNDRPLSPPLMSPFAMGVLFVCGSVVAFVAFDHSQRISYQRSEWEHWIDADRDCQTTRQEVLIAESRVPVTLSADGCRVIAGEWESYYDGEIVTTPSRLDVDHLIPLAVAHRSGGSQWSDERKRDYANDLEAPEHLVAVTARSNRQKGDRGPDAWRPERTEAWCRYGSAWASVKFVWNLSSTESERNAVLEMLVTCNK